MSKMLKLVLIAAMSMGIAGAFAEDAPVYDADNYPPQFDGQSDVGESAHASSFSGGSETLDQRLSRAEQQISNLQHRDLGAKVDALHTEVQDLRGQVEQLNHQLQLAQTQKATKPDAPAAPTVTEADLNALRTEVDTLSHQLQQLQNQRLASPAVTGVKPVISKKASQVASIPDAPAPVAVVKKTKKSIAAEAKPAVATPAVAVDNKNAEQPNVAEEQQIYQTAYDFIKAKKYTEAIAALQKMLKKYPSGQFAANAHYWLGELYELTGNHDRSAEEFATVVSNYPDSPKVSDAQLKLGVVLAAQFKWADAKTELKKVINQYPGTASARLAAEQLKQIREAGH